MPSLCRVEAAWMCVRAHTAVVDPAHCPARCPTRCCHSLAISYALLAQLADPITQGALKCCVCDGAECPSCCVKAGQEPHSNSIDKPPIGCRGDCERKSSHSPPQQSSSFLRA